MCIKILTKFISFLLWPIAVPGWGIEKIVRRYKPYWYFNRYSATPYFIALNSLSVFWVVSQNSITKWIGLYLISSMELLAIWVCICIAIGKYNIVTELLVISSKRGNQYGKVKTTLTLSSLYITAISYLYSIFCFGIFNFFVFKETLLSYKGVESTESFYQLLDFIYYSTVTATTLGYGDIIPIKPIPKILVIIEVLAGVFFVVFLFSAYVSFYVSKLSKDKELK